MQEHNHSSELKSNLLNEGGVKWNSDNYLNEGGRKEQLWLLKVILALLAFYIPQIHQMIIFFFSSLPLLAERKSKLKISLLSSLLLCSTPASHNVQ